MVPLTSLRQNQGMSSYSRVELETERLQIRAWGPEDAEGAYAIYSDPEVVEFIGNEVQESVETQRESLIQIIRAYDYLDIGMGSFPLIEKATEEIVGAVLLKPLPLTEDLDEWRALRHTAGTGPRPSIHEIEVGWHLAKAHWGRGFATEAAKRMLAYGFEELGLSEIYAVLFQENARSAAVARRLGMRHLGSTERFYGFRLEAYVTP